MQETKSKARDRQMVYYPPEDIFDWLKGVTDRGALITEALRALRRAQRAIPDQCHFFAIDFSGSSARGELVQESWLRSAQLLGFIKSAAGRVEYHVFYGRGANPPHQIAIDVFAGKAIIELPDGTGLRCDWDEATRTALPLRKPGERWVFAESTVAHFHSFAHIDSVEENELLS